MEEGFTNFATSALVSPSPLAGSSTSITFTCTTGQGVLFPTANFIITMDTEIMLIVSRVGDAFTVASGGRAYDNSVLASHNVGAVIQHTWCATNAKHIWQNIADSYSADVPPVQARPGVGVASAYDNEFETPGSWTFTPTQQGITKYSVNTLARSHLVLNRVLDSTTYIAYTPFVIGIGPFTAVCKLSQSTDLKNSSASDQAQTHFFVSDQTNPVATGTRFRVDLLSQASISNNQANPSAYTVRVMTDTTGNDNQISMFLPVSINAPVYLRITYNGAGTWTGWAGNGYTYWLVGQIYNFTFTPATLGLNFYTYIPSHTNITQTVLVDYVRVTMADLGPYGNP